jgi:hypothetical protein
MQALCKRTSTIREEVPTAIQAWGLREERREFVRKGMF